MNYKCFDMSPLPMCCAGGDRGEGRGCVEQVELVGRLGLRRQFRYCVEGREMRVG